MARTTCSGGWPEVPRRLCLRNAEGAQKDARSNPCGNRLGQSLGEGGGREGCVWSLEARQGLGGRGNGRGPRLCLDSGFAPGPASRRRLTSLRFGPPGRRAGPPRWGFWISLTAPPAAASASAPRPGIPSLPDPHCGPAALPPTRLYLLLERAEGAVEAGAASSSAQRCAVGPQPFPAAATALSRAALGWREP